MNKLPIQLSWIFAFVISLVYGVISAGQILGFLGLYRDWLAISFSILITAAVFHLYLKTGRDFYIALHGTQAGAANKKSLLEWSFAFGGLTLFIILVLLPLIRWPFSPIASELPWDAGLYHFPKAIEMLSTGSAWDLSIAYGEYPFGYESLAALVFSLNHAGLLLGSMHALIALLFYLDIVLLSVRFTRLPWPALLFVTSLLILGQFLAREFDSNIWWIFWPQTILVGKNDLLLAAGLLAVLFHAPNSRQGPFFIFGLAVASMIALSIKPSAGLVILFAWLAMLLLTIRSHQFKRYVKDFLWSALVMLPGLLWAVRNLLVQGRLFSPESLTISAWSIASNLNNPYLYNNLPQHFYFILAILGLTLVVAVFKPSIRFHLLVAVLLFATFILSPASAFFGDTQVRAQLAWRFAMPMLAYLFILLMILFEPVILKVYNWLAQKKWKSIPLGASVFGFSLLLLWNNRGLLAVYPGNGIILHDQYHTAVGVDGYHSAYDYVQKNVHHSVVNVENGWPFFLYDQQFTNSVTRSRPADFLVYIKTSWSGDEPSYPGFLDQPEWVDKWQLRYEDPEGRVYQRK